MPAKNRQILLASRPKGEPTPDHFKLIESEIPTPGQGQMLLRTIYLSLDPYMRGRMSAGKSYAKPVEVGEVMEGRAVGEVIGVEVIRLCARRPGLQPGSQTHRVDGVAQDSSKNPEFSTDSMTVVTGTSRGLSPTFTIAQSPRRGKTM